jgi:hypothetical protein
VGTPAVTDPSADSESIPAAQSPVAIVRSAPLSISSWYSPPRPFRVPLKMSERLSGIHA